MALPGTIILLAVIGVIGVKTYIVMAILGILLSAVVYRVMLGVAQSVRQRLFVDAARVNGLGSLRVNLVHVLPVMATVIAVQAAQLFGIGILIIAGLAFLGFGPAEPQPSWGVMIQDASQQVYDRPVADGAHRCRARPDRRRRQRTGRRHRPQGSGREDPGPPQRRAVTITPPSEAIAADPGAVLDVRDLTVTVDDGPALVTEVSFSLQPGRVLGLVGESGCGKTMTARSLMGLLPDGVSVTGGSIRWQGRDLAGLDEKAAQRRPRPGDRDDLAGADGRPGPDVLRRAPADPADPPVPRCRSRRGEADRRRAAAAGRHRRRRRGC